jgi:hypothetical protein
MSFAVERHLDPAAVADSGCPGAPVEHCESESSEHECQGGTTYLGYG